MLPRPIPERPSRETLLVWVRSNAPDLRLRRARLADGRLACRADFTFGGEAIVVEAVESEGIADASDEIVRRCAWLMYRRLGLPVKLEDDRRRQLEMAIVDAERAGQSDVAASLGRELAMANDSSGATSIATRFEPMGGSMFHGERAQVQGSR